MEKLKSSIAPSNREAIAEALYQCVSETAVTTMLAQNYHWNVTGMAFGPLHNLFQEIYEDHFAAQDELAERMKALGSFVDGNLSSMVNKSKVTECETPLSATDMIKNMMNAQETLASTNAGTGDIAASHGDKLSEDLCIKRGQVHEKFAWLLRSHIE
tara:strand:+ start:2793 stop:3263 length:471 start_codon:yes stop_codon:yes gene_type:complete